MCLSVIVKPRQWGGPGPIGAVEPWKNSFFNVGLQLLVSTTTYGKYLKFKASNLSTACKGKSINRLKAMFATFSQKHSLLSHRGKILISTHCSRYINICRTAWFKVQSRSLNFLNPVFVTDCNEISWILKDLHITLVTINSLLFAEILSYAFLCLFPRCQFRITRSR
jgi:hypothetical protein